MELKLVLKDRLHTMPNSIENQKKIIRSLTLLEYDGDPGWEVIQEHNKYIKHKLNETSTFFITTEMNLESGAYRKATRSKGQEILPSSVVTKGNRKGFVVFIFLMGFSDSPNTKCTYTSIFCHCQKVKI